MYSYYIPLKSFKMKRKVLENVKLTNSYFISGVLITALQVFQKPLNFKFVIMGRRKSPLIVKPTFGWWHSCVLKWLWSTNPGTNSVGNLLVIVCNLPASSLAFFVLFFAFFIFLGGGRNKRHSVFQQFSHFYYSYNSTLVKARLTPTKPFLRSLLALILKTESRTV